MDDVKESVDVLERVNHMLNRSSITLAQDWVPGAAKDLLLTWAEDGTEQWFVRAFINGKSQEWCYDSKPEAVKQYSQVDLGGGAKENDN